MWEVGASAALVLALELCALCLGSGPPAGDYFALLIGGHVIPLGLACRVIHLCLTLTGGTGAQLEMSIQTWPRLQSLVLELALPLFHWSWSPSRMIACLSPSADFLYWVSSNPCPTQLMYVVMEVGGCCHLVAAAGKCSALMRHGSPFFPRCGGCHE